ncbi:MAG: hypothetical protein U9R75_10390 [Candidatus Thermoplasmatota archaeon]|nr:hypothetical protein [Candidatus Thermoplasmatota archaeon]
MNIEKGENINIDIGKMFRFDQDKMETDITKMMYSNHVYIQINPREVELNFMNIPGVKKEGNNICETVKIIMPFSGAQSFANVLLETMASVYNQGGMEEYNPDEIDEKGNKSS